MQDTDSTISGATDPLFSGPLTFMGCPVLSSWEDEYLCSISSSVSGSTSAIVALGIPFDLATSNRPGARFGPRSIRVASKMLSWAKTYGWEHDIYRNQSVIRVYDGGDLEFDYGQNGHYLIGQVDRAIKKMVKHRLKPLIIGGDHFISYPVLKALFEHQMKEPIPLIHFDAHCDTWPDENDRIDHGTGFYRALKEGIIDPDHSIQIGIRTDYSHQSNIEVIDAFACCRLTPEEIGNCIIDRVGDKRAYLTIDIDVLDPAYAPGTGTPTTGGMTPLFLMEVLRQLKSIVLLGADLVEVSPPYDHAEVTALAGANLATYEGHLLSGLYN